MPYTVEATGNGSDGGEEGVGHPDGEDGIFLPDTLPCSNVISRGLANVTPYVNCIQQQHRVTKAMPRSVGKAT